MIRSLLQQRGIWPLLIFTGLYLLAAVWLILASGNHEFLIYVVIMLVLIAVVAYVHSRVNLSLGALWCLSIWGLLHMAGGLVELPEGWPYEGENAVLYSWWLIPDLLKYDQIVHAFGFGTTTWVAWQGLRSMAPSLNPSVGVLTLCVVAGMGFGALNEIIEFVAVLVLPETNVGGYINTGWDLVANAVGCVIAAVLIRLLNDPNQGSGENS